MQGERQKRAAHAAKTMTNKTDKNSNKTRSWAEAPSKIEQLSTNTNPLRKFEATLSSIEHSWAKVIIEAGSLAEAEEKASEIEADEVGKWNSCECRVEVHSVDPVEGDRADD